MCCMNSRYGYRSVFFLRGVGNEVVLCVSTLMLTARGLSLSEIAWMLTLGFAATTLLEVPSGVIGDLWGRKRLWILSVLCSLGWLIACLSGVRVLIVFGAVLNGVGVALGSGTIDALYVEQWMEHYGKERLARAGMWSTLFTYLGFAAGAVISGALPRVWGSAIDYTLHLTVSAVIFAVMLCIGCKMIPDTVRKNSPVKRSFGKSCLQVVLQLRKTARLAKRRRLLGLVLGAAVIMGFSTVGVELYWQPRLEALASPEQLSWALAVCSFFSMAMLALSSVGAAAVLERVHSTENKVLVYAAYRFAMICIMAWMAFAMQAFWFGVLYILYYIFMGGQDAVDAVLLHESVPNRQRGTMLSVQSLALRFGGMVSQSLCGLLLLKVDMMHVWLFLAAAHGIGFGVCLLAFRAKKGDRTGVSQNMRSTS